MWETASSFSVQSQTVLCSQRPSSVSSFLLSSEFSNIPFYFHKILPVFSILLSSETSDVPFLFSINAMKSNQQLSDLLILSSFCNIFPLFRSVISCSISGSILKYVIALSLFIIHFLSKYFRVIIFLQLLALFCMTLQMGKIPAVGYLRPVLSQWWIPFQTVKIWLSDPH